MPSPIFLFLVSLPLLFRLVPMVVPEAYLEPYAWWDAKTLTDGQVGWRNMGWWETTDDFSLAAEALARKLLEFADARPGGNVLDIAHGAGESLALHLSTQPPPVKLHALTSLASETRESKDLVASRFPDTGAQIEWFTSSATYRTGRDIDHPLNPMRGFLGEKKRAWSDEDGEEFEDGDVAPAGPLRYDLVYVLDAIYHFKPSVSYFLAQVLPTLQPGTGVLAYTDILPPPKINNVLGHLILPPLLSVPARNLMSRPKSLDEYKALLERIGYEGVEVQDWSDGVWKGFASSLSRRGGLWRLVAWLVSVAERNGWKFIAVRGRRPAEAAPPVNE